MPLAVFGYPLTIFNYELVDLIQPAHKLNYNVRHFTNEITLMNQISTPNEVRLGLQPWQLARNLAMRLGGAAMPSLLLARVNSGEANRISGQQIR